MVKTFSPILNCANFRNIWSFQTCMYEGWSKGLELKWIVGVQFSAPTPDGSLLPLTLQLQGNPTPLHSCIHTYIFPSQHYWKQNKHLQLKKKWYFLMKPALFRLWWENFSHRISKTLFQTHENSGCEAEWNINAFLFQRRPYRTTAHTNTDTKTLA